MFSCRRLLAAENGASSVVWLEAHPHGQLSPSCLLWLGGPGCPAAAGQSPGCRMWPGERQNLRVVWGQPCAMEGHGWLLNRGTFFLKSARRGDNAWSPWQLQPAQGCWGGSGVSWQRCWGMLGRAASEPGLGWAGCWRPVCPGPGLISNISAF